MRNKTAAILFLGIVILGGSLVFRSMPAFAQSEANGTEKIITLVDGRTMTGVVKETKEGVELETKIGIVKFKKAEIKSIEDIKPSADEYAARKAKIDTSSSKELYELASWVWDNHRKDTDMLKKAQADLNDALDIDSSNERAKLLLRQVEAALKTGGASAPVETTGNVIKPTGKTGAAAVQDMDKYLVSQDDIYWIRLMELTPKDNVSVTFANNAVSRYIELMKGQIVDGWDKIGTDRKFRAMSPSQKVQEMMKNQSDNIDLLKDIQITRDPSFMIEFRSKVWPLAKQYCAAPQCHGGPAPKGGFKLFVMPNNVRADYTNFIILSGYRNKDGRKLIDREDINTSLFLQYGLNPKVARFVHPKVNNQDITFIFPSINAKMYKLTTQWIQGLTRPAPNYHLKYKVPFGMSVDTSGKAFFPTEKPAADEK